jgi:hypothetical protein
MSDFFEESTPIHPLVRKRQAVRDYEDAAKVVSELSVSFERAARAFNAFGQAARAVKDFDALLPPIRLTTRLRRRMARILNLRGQR